MHRVFLVEDEIVVRESIRDNLAWGTSGFSLVGEASDGEMALPLIEELRPDILITDIKMPFMDGLTLSRIVRRSMPWVKVLIISGYDEFAFAREALSIAVTDYLLKPLSSEDLMAALRRVAALIEEEARQRQRMEFLDGCLKDARQAMADRFLSDLTTGVVPSGDAIDRAKGLGLDIVGRHYLVAILRLRIPGDGEAGGQYAQFLRAETRISELIAANPEVVKFSQNLKEITLIFKGENPEELERTSYAICHSLKYELERSSPCRLSVRVGSARERIQGIAASHAEAMAAHRFDFVFGEDQVVGIGDARRLGSGRPSYLAFDTAEIQRVLKIGGQKEVDEAVSAHLRRIESPELNEFYRRFAVVELALAVARFVEELGGDPLSVLPKLGDVEELIRTAGAEQLRSFLQDSLRAALRFREERKSDRYASVIERARAFIEEHYAESEVTLHEIARFVGVSPSHFSTIFSQETGRTFIESLTETRLRRAMELLRSSSLRSSEIAYAVGYKDPHYFSFLFKSKTGVTPTDYRQGREPGSA